MWIKSRFKGICRACGQSIRVGDDIDWIPGIPGAVHAECPSPFRLVEETAGSTVSCIVNMVEGHLVVGHFCRVGDC